jgi:hypothetical protein
MAKKNQKVIELEVPVDSDEELMDFEAWYALRHELIPAHHHKEILRADFNARKVPEMAKMITFDFALKQYGVDLV